MNYVQISPCSAAPPTQLTSPLGCLTYKSPIALLIADALRPRTIDKIRNFRIFRIHLELQAHKLNSILNYSLHMGIRNIYQLKGVLILNEDS